MEKYGADSTGCYVAGHHGMYGGNEVMVLAKDLGWTGKVTGPYDDDYLVDLDEAETWLNEHVTEEGYSFGWHDGEFFLMSQEDWQSL